VSEAATRPQPQITIHPAAAIFPMMSDEELAEMADSIKKHGLREKIHAVISANENTTDWEVIDGRNRLEALRRYLKVSDVDLIASYMTPITMSGAYTPEEYVMMANIERRNLTQSQRRDLAGKLAIMLEERQKDIPKAEQIDTLQTAADKTGVSRRTAATAKKEAVTKAKAPEKVKGKPAEPKYVPLRPANAASITKNVYTTMAHVENMEKGGKKIEQMYLENWTIEEVREVQQACQAIVTLAENYLVPRLEREQEALEAKLEAMKVAGVKAVS
jgi:hypothetical protein